jgi:hypothetical protein
MLTLKKKEKKKKRWCRPVSPGLEKLRQKSLKFKASLGYIVRLCLKKQMKKGSESTDYVVS